MKEGYILNNKVLDPIYFKDATDILEDIFEQIDTSEDYISATIVGKYEDIRQILNLVISDYVVEIGDISLCSEECNGYKDEYALTLIDDEDVGIVVHCSPLRGKSGYLYYGADIVYILENCNSAVQRYCETDARFVIIGEEECECECRYECCDCDENNIYGFTVDNETDNGYSKFTYYSSSPVDKTDIHNILREFGF